MLVQLSLQQPKLLMIPELSRYIIGLCTSGKGNKTYPTRFISNMLTDQVAALSILEHDPIFAIFTSLQSENQPTVSAALEASLNLTLLNEEKVSGNQRYLL